MQWKPAVATDWHQLSECRRYSVCRIGPIESPTFEVWRTRWHEDGPRMVRTGFETSQAARQAAEEDDDG